MAETADQPIAVLAFDHREQAFSSVRPAGMSDDEIRRAKELIYEAFRAALAQGLGPVQPGILIDERFGSEIARDAIARGVTVMMPVERAAERVFTFEYGDDYADHLRRLRPNWAKALVHHLPTDPEADKAVQLERLRELSDFLAAENIPFMFELIVGEGEPDDNGVPGADVEVLRQSMAEIQDAGIRVSAWKVQGLASTEDAALIAAQAGGSEHPAPCVVLGAGAPSEVIEHWLDVASATDGFSGFAIGRSIWGEPVTQWLDGKLSRESAIAGIAATYRSHTLRYVGVDSAV